MHVMACATRPWQQAGRVQLFWEQESVDLEGGAALVQLLFVVRGGGLPLSHALLVPRHHPVHLLPQRCRLGRGRLLCGLRASIRSVRALLMNYRSCNPQQPSVPLNPLFTCPCGMMGCL